MLIQLTGFSPTDRMYSDTVIIESTAITSIIASHTGDRQDYTTITADGTFFVQETVVQIMDKIKG